MHQQPGYLNGNKRSALGKFDLSYPDRDSPAPKGSCDRSHASGPTGRWGAVEERDGAGRPPGARPVLTWSLPATPGSGPGGDPGAARWRALSAVPHAVRCADAAPPAVRIPARGCGRMTSESPEHGTDKGRRGGCARKTRGGNSARGACRAPRAAPLSSRSPGGW
ncbi:hypothetical protein GCM10018785_73440 [Streptomyces longispororuber]|uniref:Uncharacterized protein n=1 Tax=Streptomyces longispororuber TaxID=68230 RepID=A0A919AEV5_9ACTN|nr:hypothetical protein GCM10018785_73440 [Streptomyces longispororuber]